MNDERIAHRVFDLADDALSEGAGADEIITALLAVAVNLTMATQGIPIAAALTSIAHSLERPRHALH